MEKEYEEIAELLVGDNALERYTHEELKAWVVQLLDMACVEGGEVMETTSDENWHCDVCDDMKHDDSIAWSECHRDANDWEIICKPCHIELEGK